MEAKSKFQTLLIIGSSVDRYALWDSYPNKTFTSSETNKHLLAVDKEGRQLGIAYIGHAGVGLNGDLDYPFFQAPNLGKTKWQFFPTWQVIKHAPEFSMSALGTYAPDLVVVETSLWDLSVWWQKTGHKATPERLQQWCDKDLPYLLKSVSDVFPQSRIVFRTAPKAAPRSVERWTPEDFVAMHDCVLRRSAGTGKVFERVGVIDYYDIMEKLFESTARTDPDHVELLWRADGYHPSPMPSRLYFNEIYKLLGVKEQAPGFVRVNERRNSVEDEDDLSLA
jgi:hypothetical protein